MCILISRILLLDCSFEGRGTEEGCPNDCGPNEGSPDVGSPIGGKIKRE